MINLENIFVVLSEPKGPMNVGSVARAMNNMGLKDLVLVNPCEYTGDESRKMASGCNKTLLGAKVFSSTKDAVSKAGFVVGMTCRTGKYRQHINMPDELALNQHSGPLQIAGIARRIVGKEANSLIVKITNPVDFEFLVVDQWSFVADPILSTDNLEIDEFSLQVVEV